MRRLLVTALLLAPCASGCGSPPAPAFAESGGISVFLREERGASGPFAHPSALEAARVETILRKTWATRKKTGPVRTEPGPFFSAIERPMLASLLSRALGTATATQRVRVEIRHEGGRPARRSVVDFFVKDDALHVLFQEMLVADTPMSDATRSLDLYPRLHPREGQTVRAEPGLSRPARGPGPAPAENWLSIPLSQALEAETGPEAGDLPELAELQAKIALLDEALHLGVLTPEEYRDKRAALERSAEAVRAERRRVLDEMLAQGLLQRDEYDRKIEELRTDTN